MHPSIKTKENQNPNQEAAGCSAAAFASPSGFSSLGVVAAVVGVLVVVVVAAATEDEEAVVSLCSFLSL